jgi:hypothetical protein
MRALLTLAGLATLGLASPSPAQDTTRIVRQDTTRTGRLPLVEPTRRLAYTVDRVVDRVPATSQDLAIILESQLFPPDLIMQNQSRLQITEAQRATITSEISKLQSAVVQMQWGVADETQRLLEQLRQPSNSEERALSQVDRLIALETAVKRAQLTMLIRIRNALTPRQVETLMSIRGR